MMTSLLDWFIVVTSYLDLADLIGGVIDLIDLIGRMIDLIKKADLRFHTNAPNALQFVENEQI